LIPRLTHDDFSVRSSTVEALGRLGSGAAEATPQLIRLLTDDQPYIQSRAIWALGIVGPTAGAAIPHIVPFLLDLRINDPDSLQSCAPIELAKGAAEALRRIGAAAVSHLIALLTDDDSNVRSGAIWGLGMIGAAAAEAVPHIIPFLLKDGFW